LPENDRLLTVAQAAELLGTSERFPRRLIAERRIRFVRLGENGNEAMSAFLSPRCASSSRPVSSSR
jgi:excisionase family DNA binding protein